MHGKSFSGSVLVKRTLRAAALAVPIALTMGGVARASTLFFDADASAAGNINDGTNLGGTGTWDNGVTSNWWDGVSGADQVWANGNDAIIYSTGSTVTPSGLLSGGLLTKRGTGNLTFSTTSAANTWTGKLLVEAGRYQTSAFGLPTDTGAPVADAITLTNNAAIWANNIGGTMQATNANVGLTIGAGGGTIVGGGLNAETTTWNGAISGSNPLTVIFGTARFTNMGTYSGTLSVNAGGNGQGDIHIDGTLSPTMNFGAPTVAPSGGGGQIQINSNNTGTATTVTIANGASAALSPQIIINNNNALGNVSSINVAGTNVQLSFGGAFTQRFDSGSIPSVIAGASGAISKSGAGVLTLSGVNTFGSAGNVTNIKANGGLISGAAAANFGSDVSTNTISLDGGGIQATQNFVMLRQIAVTANNGTIDVAPTKILTLQGSGTNAISGALGTTLTKTGTGTLNLTQASNQIGGFPTADSTWRGDLHVVGGIVNLGVGGTTGYLPNRGDSNQFNGTNGLLTLPNVDLDAGTILQFQHSGGNNRHLVQINGAGNVEFNGSTTETLFGHNTYTGTTTITGGNVRIGLGGSITPSGALGNTAVTIAASRNLEFHNDSEVTSFPGSTTGAGTVTFAGQNTITLTGSNSPSAITVNAGGPGVVALQNSSGNAISAPITLTSGKLKLLLSDQIADTSNLILNGGTLDLNDLDDAMNVVTLTANSFIEMGGSSGSVLQFADSIAATWTGGTFLTINNWSGTPYSGLGADQVKFDSSNSALTPGKLAQVQFLNPAGLPAGTYPAQFAANNPGEVVPAPEPGTISLLAGLAGMALIRRRRRD